jgi:hypothetical protein
MSKITLTLMVIGILFYSLISSGCRSDADKIKEVKPAVEPPKFVTSPALTPVQRVPEVSYVTGALNIFFYQNVWFYFCNGIWFVSQSYNGPWMAVETYTLPVIFGEIPAMYFRDVLELKSRSK